MIPQRLGQISMDPGVWGGQGEPWSVLDSNWTENDWRFQGQN